MTDRRLWIALEVSSEYSAMVDLACRHCRAGAIGVSIKTAEMLVVTLQQRTVGYVDLHVALMDKS